MVTEAQRERQQPPGTPGAASPQSDPFVGRSPSPEPSMTAQFDALRQQLGRYMSIEADRVRLSIRRFAVRLILGLAAAVIGLATLVTAAVSVKVGVKNNINYHSKAGIQKRS